MLLKATLLYRCFSFSLTIVQRRKKGQNPVAQWVISIISVLEATDDFSYPALKKGIMERKICWCRQVFSEKLHVYWLHKHGQDALMFIRQVLCSSVWYRIFIRRFISQRQTRASKYTFAIWQKKIEGSYLGPIFQRRDTGIFSSSTNLSSSLFHHLEGVTLCNVYYSALSGFLKKSFLKLVN